MANLDIIRGRQLVATLTNKSGGAVAAGDVVVVDTTTDESFTTLASASAERSIGIVQETIASNAAGRVLLSGYAPLVNVAASVTRGHYLFTSATAKQATGSATRAAGAFGQFLTTSATPTAWIWGVADQTATAGSAAFVGAKAYNSVVQSLANNTDTALTLDSEEYDTDAIHDTATNTSRLTVPAGKAGKWRFRYHTFSSATNATGIRATYLRKNGTTKIRGSNDRRVGSTAVNPTLEGGADIELIAGDYVEVIGFQNSGGALDFGFADATNPSTVTVLEAEFLG